MPGTNESRTSTSSLRPSHVRSAALAAAVVGVVVLPIAAAQATPSHPAKQTSAAGAPATGTPATAQALLPQYCGATHSGFQGTVTAQPCVNYADGAVTGVVYVGNTTGKPVTVGINLTRTDGSLASMTCTVPAGETNGSCTTGALREAGGKGAFDAIAELLPEGSPVALGVLHVESGPVAPDASGAAAGGGQSPSAAPVASASPAA
jgi:hypothetical protein